MEEWEGGGSGRELPMLRGQNHERQQEVTATTFACVKSVREELEIKRGRERKRKRERERGKERGRELERGN